MKMLLALKQDASELARTARAGCASHAIRPGIDTCRLRYVPRGSLAPATLRCRARNGNLRSPISHLPVIFRSRHRPSSTLTGPIGDFPQRQPATEKRAGPPESL
jgi:hypothetical protein